MTGRRPPVYVTPHAVDRAIKRFPGDFPGNRRAVAARIYLEVERAIEQQRVAKTKPRWVVTEDGPRTKARGTDRFAWDAEERHCYVIVTGSTQFDGRRTVVITTLAAYDEEWRERARAKNG